MYFVVKAPRIIRLLWPVLNGSRFPQVITTILWLVTSTTLRRYLASFRLLCHWAYPLCFILVFTFPASHGPLTARPPSLTMSLQLTVPRCDWSRKPNVASPITPSLFVSSYSPY